MQRDQVGQRAERLRGIRATDVAAFVALAALATLVRLQPLAPSSLWIDDAWAALVVKEHTAHDLDVARGTTPGFSFLLKGWLSALGFSELNAQLLPLFFGVATPPLLYVVLRGAGIRQLPALLGSLVLVGSVVHMTYSTRVKQYTLDAFIAVIVLTAAWWLVRDVESRRRWWIFAATCVAGIVLASPMIVLAASSTCVALAVLARERPQLLRHAVAPAGVVAIFAALWWWLLLRPHVNAALKDYWSGYFIPYDRGVTHAVFVAARGVKDVCAGAVPPSFTSPSVAAFVIAGAVVVLLAFRRTTPALLFVIAPLAVALFLTAAHAVPLGTGRTDIYLYPGLAMALALAANELHRRWMYITTLGAVLIVATEVATFKPILPYPARDVKPLVAELERRVSPSDSVLVRPDDDFAFGLYTTWPVSFLAADAPTAFAVRVDHANVHVPLIVPIDAELHTESWRTAISNAERRSSSIWLLTGGHNLKPRLVSIRGILRGEEFQLELELTRPGADLTLWTRAH